MIIKLLTQMPRLDSVGREKDMIILVHRMIGVLHWVFTAAFRFPEQIKVHYLYGAIVQPRLWE